jgi:hypothetical protein
MIFTNPYKLEEEYFCECYECKEHRKISIHTFRAMNRKKNPISKRCRKCFALSNKIEDYKLVCLICKNQFEVDSARMCLARKKDYKYYCINCNNNAISERGEKYRFKKGHVPKTKGINPNKKQDDLLRQKEWARNNKKSINIKRQLVKYSLDLKQYSSLLEEHNNSCGICGIHQKELKKCLCIDHCHITGKVRGFLCSKCNSGIGMFNDNIKNLQKAVIYLNKYINE